MMSQNTGYSAPRIVCTVFFFVLLASLYPAVPLTRWFNSIPNLTSSYEKWKPAFFLFSRIASAGVLLSAVVSLCVRLKSLRVAGFVAIPCMLFSLRFPLEYFFVIPAAFYGAAVVLSLLHAWRKKGTPWKIIVTNVMATVVFLLSVYGSLLCAKLMALDWAAAMDH
ncbi:MAG: hypothetical protein JXA11_11015 [Phycisphaerae bacterium]|nr:hypothetical protein [Phycisphaerae bacterium]